MKRKQYNVVFTGKLNRHKRFVQSKLATHFKMDASIVKRFIEGIPFYIKKDINYNLAYRLKTAFSETGAICHLVETLPKPAASSDLKLVSKETNLLEDTQEIIKCPNCNLRQEKTTLCDSCGIVFNKFFGDLKRKGMIYLEDLEVTIKDRRLDDRRQIIDRRREIRMANERRLHLDRRKLLNRWHNPD
ncbi:MAG: hypothetical protein KAR20_07255 [Candidatus Heimdallarchaeota archaeon]|nr:hypothetical protein [Candidatus Heimdallarchaeota archaeon]